jgi:hypothetical protein
MRGRVRRFQLLGPVLDHRVHAEDRQVDRTGGVHAPAGPRDLLEDDEALGDAEPVAAVLLGRGDPNQPPVANV